MSITACVIGLGSIGLLYDVDQKDYVLTHTRAYLRDRRFSLLFGVDPDTRKRRLFTAMTKQPAFASLKETRRNFPQVDVISVATPVERRPAIVPELFVFRPKVFIWEKPVAADTLSAARLMGACHRHDVALCVNYLRRFDGYLDELKRLLRKRTYGKLLGINVFYNGGFYNNASHFIDFLSVVVGEPKSWKVMKESQNGRDVDLDFDLHYPGFTVTFKVVRAKCPVGDIEFWLDWGRVEYRNFGLDVQYFNVQQDRVFKMFKEYRRDKSVPSRLPYAMAGLLDNVYGFIKNNEPLLSNGGTAWRTLRLCELIRQKS